MQQGMTTHDTHFMKAVHNPHCHGVNDITDMSHKTFHSSDVTDVAVHT